MSVSNSVDKIPSPLIPRRSVLKIICDIFIGNPVRLGMSLLIFFWLPIIYAIWG